MTASPAGSRIQVGTGATQLSLAAERRVRDLADQPVISPALNSLLSQEAGDDYGDYVLLNGATAGIRHRLSGTDLTVSLELGVEESRSVGGQLVTRQRPLPAQSRAGCRHVSGRAGGAASAPVEGSRCSRTSRDGWRSRPAKVRGSTCA